MRRSEVKEKIKTEKLIDLVQDYKYNNLYSKDLIIYEILRRYEFYLKKVKQSMLYVNIDMDKNEINSELMLIIHDALLTFDISKFPKLDENKLTIKYLINFPIKFWKLNYITKSNRKRNIESPRYRPYFYLKNKPTFSKVRRDKYSNSDDYASDPEPYVSDFSDNLIFKMRFNEIYSSFTPIEKKVSNVIMDKKYFKYAQQDLKLTTRGFENVLDSIRRKFLKLHQDY